MHSLVITILALTLSLTPAWAIVIATHSAQGIIVGTDSLEATQSVLIDQLYSQKIYRINSLVYACFSSLDSATFQICHNLRVVAKGAEFEGRLLGVSEIATYAHNLASGMSSGPHLVLVGSEVGRILTGQGEGDGESRRVPQKIFEVSSSGFMTEQSVATGGAGSGSALLILENSKLDMKVRDKPASASKTMKRIRKILEALRAADSSVHGKVRMFLLPNAIGEKESILPMRPILV